MFSFKSLLAPAAIALASLASVASAQTFKTDQGHTEVLFSWVHAGVSTQTAEFTVADGTLVIDRDNVEAASLNVVIDANSIHSGFGPLDDHLKAADFLDVEKFPEITFASTKVEQVDDTTAKVTGNLTIHGVTQEVVLDTKLTHNGPHPLADVIDYYQGDWMAFSATTVIEDHQVYGVGGFSTGPITVTISTEMKAEE